MKHTTALGFTPERRKSTQRSSDHFKKAQIGVQNRRSGFEQEQNEKCAGRPDEERGLQVPLRHAQVGGQDREELWGEVLGHVRPEVQLGIGVWHPTFD